MSQRPKDSGKLNSTSNLVRVDNVVNYYESKDGVVSKIKLERKKSAGRFFVKSKRPDRPAFLTKKNIESRSYESNIARLNDELKKTGMLSEKMTTSTVLVPTETQPYIPPTTSDIPDTSGLLGNSFSQPSYGGDESDPSTWDTGWNSNAYLKNPDTFDGEANRPILAQPDAPYPYDDGAGSSAIVSYGGFYGTSVGLITPDNKYRQILVGGLTGGTNVPTEASRGFGGIYRGLNDEQFNYAVSFYNRYSELKAKYQAGEIGIGSLKVWVMFNNHHHGGNYDAYSGVKSNFHVLQTVLYYKQSNTYISDPGQPRTIVLNRLEDPDSPEFYPGDFSRYLANLLNLGKRGYDYLNQVSGGEEEEEFGPSDNVNPNLIGRGIRSTTDPIRYSGSTMFQGNPAGRSPGLSNYWSPDPATAGTYSNPGSGKGVPGARPNPTGTITSAQRPPGTPRVSRSPLGQPQFKFPKGTPPPSKMITQMADDAAVSAGRKVAATTAGKTLGRVVPFVSIGISIADAGIRASNGDYAGAVLSGISAVPGPIGWAALGLQLVSDSTGVTGVKEQKEFANYDEYLRHSRELVKNNNIKIDNNAMLALMLREIAKTDKLTEEDKAFLVAIFMNAEGLTSEDIVSFVKKIQKKLMDEVVSESVILSEGWQSPDHTNIEKDQKTRWFSPNAGTDSKKWFDPEQVAPVYPKNPPPGMINGYSVKSNLAPKFVEKGPIIKLTKKDLLRNHRLKDSEVKEMVETINRLNEFLAKHPEELIYAQSRYPKNDPRLAELNWKQDEMRRANDEYVERQFPINKTVFKRTQEAIKRNIELTDPKSFKVTSTPIRHQDVTENKVRSIKKYMKQIKKTKPHFLKKKGKPNS